MCDQCKYFDGRLKGLYGCKPSKKALPKCEKPWSIDLSSNPETRLIHKKQHGIKMLKKYGYNIDDYKVTEKKSARRYFSVVTTPKPSKQNHPMLLSSQLLSSQLQLLSSRPQASSSSLPQALSPNLTSPHKFPFQLISPRPEALSQNFTSPLISPRPPQLLVMVRSRYFLKIRSVKVKKWSRVS